tara:strand:- start:3954 stop:4466 length:513 start_codon:yes stop_codon:yes gene_type:complete
MSDFKNNAISEFPNIAKVEFKKVNQNYLKVILINFFLVFIPLLVVLSFSINKKLFEETSDYIALIYSIFFVISTVMIIFLIVSFSRRKYVVRDKDISYSCGVIIKTITTVPFSRIQHVEIDQGPISRFFGLSSLTVFTAGDSSSDLEISGIKNEQALQIKEFISSNINES